MLGPIIGNIGNLLYVGLALVGGVFLLIHLPNVSLSGSGFCGAILFAMIVGFACVIYVLDNRER